MVAFLIILQVCAKAYSKRFDWVQLLCTVAAGDYTYTRPCTVPINLVGEWARPGPAPRDGAVDGGGGDVGALGGPAASALGSVTGHHLEARLSFATIYFVLTRLVFGNFGPACPHPYRKDENNVGRAVDSENDRNQIKSSRSMNRSFIFSCNLSFLWGPVCKNTGVIC